VAPTTWTILIYTVPASPTRKRAAVWREVKRLGALYLRDGVCALPDTQPARTGLESLAERVRGLGGQATLIWSARLSPSSAAGLFSELVQVRQAEYAEAAEAARELLQHIRTESAHHSFHRATLTSFIGDVGRLERWLGQIVARDYLRAGDPAPITEMLAVCRAELEQHASRSSRRAG
jgi:hypothetical protein